MSSIVTITLNPSVDRSCEVEHVMPEHKLSCEAVRDDPGGGGINVARAIHVLGGEVTAWWASAGTGGQLLAKRLDEQGIPHHPIPVPGETRQNLIVYERTTDQQYRFGMPGPELPPHEAARFVETVQALDPPPDYAVLSGSVPPGAPDDLWARMIRALPRSVSVILDTRGAPLRHALDAGVRLVKPNLRELSQLSERTLSSDAEIAAAAHALVNAGKAEVVLTSIGAGGAFLVTAEGFTHVRSPTVPIRSKVGAGDSTVAGATLALSRGASYVEAARFAVAAGAAAVMTAVTGLCRREDAERLYAEMK